MRVVRSRLVLALAIAICLGGCTSQKWYRVGSPSSESLGNCPSQLAGEIATGVPIRPWVPVQPLGFDGFKELVPSEVPTRGLLCWYDGWNTTQHVRPLSGQRQIEANRLSKAKALHSAQWFSGEAFPCTAKGGPQRNLLMGLRYANATVWVSTAIEPNHCVISGNGEFESADGVISEVLGSLVEE